MGERYTGKDLYIRWESLAGTVALSGSQCSLATAESIDTADATAGADEHRQYLPTLRVESATLDLLDDLALAEWEALTPGTAGTLVWAPAGTAGGAIQYSSAALVTSRDRTISYDDVATATVEFSLQREIEAWSEQMVDLGVVYGPAAYGGDWRTPVTVDAFAGYTLNDADNAVAQLLSLPKTGTITHVGLVITAIVGSPPSYTIALVALGGDGFPSAGNYGGSTPGTLTPSATGWVWIPLATPASAQAGNMVAAIIKPGGTAPNSSNYISVPYQGAMGGGIANVGIMRFSTAWLSLSGLGPMAVRYDDGTIWGLAASQYSPNSNIATNTNPDEVGNLFSLPCSAVCTGARVAISSTGSNAPFQVRLYDASDAVVASATVTDIDHVQDYGLIDLFWDPVSLPAGNYRLTVLPTSTTTIRVGGLQFISADARKAPILPAAGNWQRTHRTDEGAWTKVDTDLMYMALHLSQITVRS